MTWSSNDTVVNPQELFRSATYNLNEIVRNISVHFLTPDKNGKSDAIIDLEDNPGSFKEVIHRNYGRCYTFFPELAIRKLGIDHIKAYL